MRQQIMRVTGMAAQHSTAQHNSAMLWSGSSAAVRPTSTAARAGCDAGRAARGRDWVLIDPSNCKASDRCR